jgi:hypothetical protein
MESPFVYTAQTEAFSPATGPMDAGRIAVNTKLAQPSVRVIAPGETLLPSTIACKDKVSIVGCCCGPCREAAEDIKRKRATSGFMEGLAMGMLRETPENVRDYFWEESPESNPFFEEAGQLAQTYYNGALALGFAQGTNVALKGLGKAFWTDLRKQVSEPLGDPDAENWGRKEWIEFYIAAGVAFAHGHITD